jgi:hypothetical protein
LPRLLAVIDELYGDPQSEGVLIEWRVLAERMTSLCAGYAALRPWHLDGDERGRDMDQERAVFLLQLVVSLPGADTLLPRAFARLRRLLAGRPAPSEEALERGRNLLLTGVAPDLPAETA